MEESSTYFDILNSGQRVHTGWASDGEGMLIYEPGGVFGPITQDSQMVAGFDVLKALDSNHDGKLDASDEAFGKLAVWVTDSSATFKPGSLHSLADLGIVSIDLNAQRVNIDDHGNAIRDISNFTWSDGSRGAIAGVDLAYDPYQVMPPNPASDIELQLVGTQVGNCWS